MGGSQSADRLEPVCLPRESGFRLGFPESIL